MITDPLEALKKIKEIADEKNFILCHPKFYENDGDIKENLKRLLDEISQLADEVIFSCEL